MYDGGSSQPGDIEKHCKAWEGRFLRTGSVGGFAKVKTSETALGLNEAAGQASQPGAAAAAAGPPTADGGGGTASQPCQPGAAAAAAGHLAADGGGGTGAVGPLAADGCGGGGIDAKAIELAHKTSAIQAQIGQLEQRNGFLEKPIQTPNFKFAPLMNYLNRCALSLPN